MEYKRLGTSGLQVAPLCIGALTFGDTTDASEAARIMSSGYEAGINFIDTADVYVQGESERMVGRLIGTRRDHWILATKVGNAMEPGPNQSGASRRWLMQACEASLRRLATDYIDLYYLHIDADDAPLEETICALGDLIRAGKIRYFGLSNFRAWRVAAVVHLCRALGVSQPIAVQPCYNAMNRMAETELIPCAHSLGLGVIPYSPLARGVLTGKYVIGELPGAETRAGRGDKRLLETEFRQASMALAQIIRRHAEVRGMTAGQFALNWVLNNALVTSLVTGPRTFGQWTEYLGALQHKLNADDEALIDSLVAPGHPSTPGYNDPRYPLRGRLVSDAYL